MPIYKYHDACQKLDRLLDEARAHHDVMIQSDQGDMFLLTLVTNTHFQNYLPHLDIGRTREEIVSYIREVRER